MAVNPDIHDRAYQFFIEEVPELLQAIEDGILQLRQDRSANIVHEVMRAAHSIKGGAASVELEAIKDIAHRLETAFRALYDESVEIDMELETFLLQGYDCLQRPLHEQMETGSHNPEEALAKAMPVLEAIDNKLGAEALSQADSFIPSSSDLGVDMVTSIFEIDVEQGIARLEEVANNPSAFPVAGELQTQAEVFVGFGELLELPGFGKLAQAILDALTQSPDQARDILMVALEDLKAARDAVMAGDRAQGGSPSDALLAFVEGQTAPASSSAATASPATESWSEAAEIISTDDFSWNENDSPLDLDALAIQELLGETEGLEAPAQATLQPSSQPESLTESLTSAEPIAEGETVSLTDLVAEQTIIAEPTDPGMAVDNFQPSATDTTENLTLEEIALPDDAILSDKSALEADVFDIAATEALFSQASGDSIPPEPETVVGSPEQTATSEVNPSSEAPNLENAATSLGRPEEIRRPEEILSSPETVRPTILIDPWDSLTETTPVEDTSSVNLDTAAENLADLFGVETIQSVSEEGERSETPPAMNESGAQEEELAFRTLVQESPTQESPVQPPIGNPPEETEQGHPEVTRSEELDLNPGATETQINDTEDIDFAAVLGKVETPEQEAIAPEDNAVFPNPATFEDSITFEDSVALDDNAAPSGDDLSSLFGIEAPSESSLDDTNSAEIQEVEARAIAPELEPDLASAEQLLFGNAPTPTHDSLTAEAPINAATPESPSLSSEVPASAESSTADSPVAETLATQVHGDEEAAQDLSALLGAFDLPAVSLSASTSEASPEATAPEIEAPLSSAPTSSAATEIIPEGTLIQENIPSPAELFGQQLSPQAGQSEAEVQEEEARDENTLDEVPEAITNTAVQVAMAELQQEQPSQQPAVSQLRAPMSPNVDSETAGLSLDQRTETSAEASTSPETAAQAPRLDAAIQAVEGLFDQLPTSAPTPAITKASEPANITPSIQPGTPPPPAIDKAPKKAKKSEGKRAGAALSGISVRVDLGVLERMNNLVGELILNRNSLSLQNEQLQTVVRQQTQRFKNFEGLLGSLREVSDEMLVKPNAAQGATASVPSTHSPRGSNADGEGLLAGFDSLEMDRYNQLHMKLQEISEDLMQLEEGVDDIEVLLEQATQSISQQRQGLSRLQNELMWARMLPLDNILSRFPRVLRDLSAQHGKSVDLKLVGTGVLVDKAILEKLHDPMLHLLRNAFDHGIEPPEARKTQGKSECGTIEIRAFYQGNQTIIEIKDDGRGLKLDKIARRAVELGWLSREELRTIPQQVVADLIFEPGFSTAEKVSDLSGRGVGLDVVRDQLKRLKGSVSVSSNPGEGTKFSLKLPLTLSVAKLMICQVGPLALALPSDAIEDLLVPEPKRIKKVAKQPFLHWRDDLIPIHPLSELLEYACPLPDATSLKNLTDSIVPVPAEWEKPLLIFNQNEQFLAVQVDRLLMEQELVIKPFSNAANAPDYAYGCTILGDGRMIPVLDGVALVKRLTQEEATEFSGTGIQLEDESSLNATPTSIPTSAAAAIAPPSMSSVAAPRTAKTILVVDDSTAMRRTLALSLEKAGYRVLQAGDGQEALEQLRQSSTIQLVICDVEMPTMNGFEFLSQRRREPQLLQIPVVMLTSRSSDKHRRLAIQLNANSYFSKPYVEQEFLKAIHQILDSSVRETPAQV